jgi:transcriptional regulator with XRE-family HTH domain
MKLLANRAFGRRLKSSREHVGLSQEQLAAMIETSQSSISLWENGVNGARGACVFQLADALQVDARWLAIGDGLSSRPSASTQKSDISIIDRDRAGEGLRLVNSSRSR